MSAEDTDARRLSKVISHPIRARIIELLGERGALGWKELSTEVGVKTGALFHHLDALEGLVERDQSKRYSLTNSGRIVYSTVAKSRTIDSLRRAALEIRREGASRRLVVSVLAPRVLIDRITRAKPAALASFAALTLPLGVLSGLAGFSPTLYYIHTDPDLLSTLAGFAGSLAFLVVLGYASARLAFGSSADLKSLATSSSLSFIPVFVASAITVAPFASEALASSSVAYTLILVLFQTWSSTIFGAGLSVASGVRIERTILVSLAILYATMVIMLLQGARP